MLIALEVIVRAFFPQPLITVAVQEWDSRLGLRQPPGAKGRLRSPEFDCPIHIGSKGLRDKDYPYSKPEGTVRILTLGDSFTFGYGVSREETFSKALEELLGADPGRAAAWEVINGGVCGTGATHQLAFYEDEGYRYEPDFVVLCMCSENEFSDNSMSGLFSVVADTLVRHEAALSLPMRLRGMMQHIPGYRLLFMRSHLLTLVKRRISRYAFARRSGAQRDSTEIAAGRRRSLELTKALLAGLDERTRATGAQLIVTVVPRADSGDHPERVTELVQFLIARDIPYIDLEPCFRRELRAGSVVYYPVDGHWNAAGHALVARMLYEFIQDRHRGRVKR
jgi:lysophospholipase L1-like esterase